jgi:hypothetical protein
MGDDEIGALAGQPVRDLHIPGTACDAEASIVATPQKIDLSSRTQMEVIEQAGEFTVDERHAGQVDDAYHPCGVQCTEQIGVPPEGIYPEYAGINAYCGMCGNTQAFQQASIRIVPGQRTQPEGEGWIRARQERAQYLPIPAVALGRRPRRDKPHRSLLNFTRSAHPDAFRILFVMPSVGKRLAGK